MSKFSGGAGVEFRTFVTVFIFNYAVWMFTISTSDTITCQLLKHGYVNCQLEHNRFPGFGSNKEFQLLGTEVETSYNSEGCDVSTLYLKTDKNSMKFYDSCNTGKVADDAISLDSFLYGKGDSYLQIHRDKEESQGLIILLIFMTVFYFSSFPIRLIVLDWFISNIKDRRRIVLRRSLKVNKNTERYKKVKQAEEELNKRIKEQIIEESFTPTSKQDRSEM